MDNKDNKDNKGTGKARRRRFKQLEHPGTEGAKGKPPREKTVESAIRVALHERGVFCMKHRIDMRSTFGRGLGIGVADLICVVPPLGRFLAIEVKRPGLRGRTSKGQKLWLAHVAAHGGVAGIATSVEEALELVKRAEFAS